MSSEPPIEPTAEPPIEPTAEPPIEPTAEPPIEPTAEPPIEPTAEPPTEPEANPSGERAQSEIGRADSEIGSRENAIDAPVEDQHGGLDGEHLPETDADHVPSAISRDELLAETDEPWVDDELTAGAAASAGVDADADADASSDHASSDHEPNGDASSDHEPNDDEPNDGASNGHEPNGDGRADGPSVDEAPGELLPGIAALVAETPVVAVETHHKHHRLHRTWPQRGLLVLNVLVILACFVGAAGLLIGRHYGSSIAKVDLESPAAEAASATTVQPVVDDPAPDDGTTPANTVTEETFPELIDPGAKNFLITGADNNACVDPDSPYAAAFGNREEMGERSDTIMLMRVDPTSKQAAILSFPRDLYVKIAGTNRKSRINGAYVKDDPQRLIDTIYENFGLGVDHFVQIDFCAFKTIVDAVGGVTVPFAYPAKDTHTGLDVPASGCFTFDGDHALAYVRSRHYMYQNEDGKWKEDPASDLGRVSRQQDFLRRVLSSALDKGLVNPDVARGVIKAAQENIVVDSGLTIQRMLELVGVLKDFEPGAIATYQIEAVGKNVSGAAVLEPRIKGDNMQAILAIFRGEAPLAGAPEQVFDTTTSSTDPDATTTTVRGTTTTVEAPTVTVVGPDENVKGIVPPEDVSC